MTEAAKTPHPAASGDIVLDVEGLEVAYRVRGRDREVLHSLGFKIARGESYGLVGESGCGKSTAALSVMRYLPENGRLTNGRVSILGRDLYGLNARDLRHMRSHSIAMVYQDPGNALNPSLTVGRQIREVFELRGAFGEAARNGALDALTRVRITDPASVLERYPHQLSGGMQQRVCIAMALASNPALLILDEPTTGLDATVEAEVLDLIRQLRTELGTSILFISHNLAIVSEMCDRVGILYAGALAEEGPAHRLFQDPAHPYTASLLKCLPRRGQRKEQGGLRTLPGFLPTLGDTIAGCAFAERCALADDRCRRDDPPLADLGGRRSKCHYPERVGQMASSPEQIFVSASSAASKTELVRLVNVSKTYSAAAGAVKVLHNLSINLYEGETLGIVGESGSGKSTLAKTLLGLVPHDEDGEIFLDGAKLPPNLARRSEAQVKAVQIVFQNPDSALNRVRSVGQIIGRALHKLAHLSGAAKDGRLHELMRAVRLDDRYIDAFPRQLSGGMKQRVAIARAFAGAPRIVVCDEPTSALDVSVQASILNLLNELQARNRATYVFISHDLGVVRYISDRIIVLYLGRILEIGTAEQVFSNPRHPYTEALLSAVPNIDGTPSRRIELTGDGPSAIDAQAGCIFQSRCHRKIGAICEETEPALTAVEGGHLARCHLVEGSANGR
jgi:peptide/nickel transport system ATP-binding protein